MGPNEALRAARPARPSLRAVRAVRDVDADAAQGFRAPTRPEPGVPDPYPADDGLLALAARAEVPDVGAAAVEALEEVAELLARAYATTDPRVLLAQVRRRAGEVTAQLDRRSTGAARPSAGGGRVAGAVGGHGARRPG